MRNVIKIFLGVLSMLILLVIILPVVAALVFNIEAVQNYAARYASKTISENTGITISLDKIKIRNFTTVSIDDLYIADMRGDTLIYSKNLSANLSKSALVGNKIVVGDVNLDRAKIYLFQPKEGVINIAEVVDKISNKEKKGSGTTRITLRGIKIRNSRFKLQKEFPDSTTPGTMNYGNMILNDLNVFSRELRVVGPEVSMHLHDLSFTDISGMRIDNLTADNFLVGKGILDFDNLYILTPDSELRMPNLTLGEDNWKDFGNFTNKTRIRAIFNNSTLDFHTLSYFVPSFNSETHFTLNKLNLDFDGTVNDFAGRIKNASNGNIAITADFAAKNVTHINDAFFNVKIDRFVADTYGTDELLQSFRAGSLNPEVIEFVNRLGLIELSGSIKGGFKDVDADMNIATSLGNIGFDISTYTLTDGEPFDSKTPREFDGKIVSESFDIGYLLNNKMLGEVTLGGIASGTIGNGKYDITTAAQIPSFEFNDYTYNSIAIDGTFKNNTFNGGVNTFDKNLMLDFNGMLDFSKKVPSYDFKLDLERADLNALNLYKRDSVAVVKLVGDIKGKGITLDTFNSRAVLDSLVYVSPYDTVRAADITLEGVNNFKSKFLSFKSPFADAEFSSSVSYGAAFNYLSEIVYDYIPALSKTPRNSAPDSHNNSAVRIAANDTIPEAKAYLNIKQANNLAQIFLPKFNMAEGSLVELTFSPTTKKAHLSANSSYIEYDNFFVTNLNLDVSNENAVDSLNVNFTTEDIFIPNFKTDKAAVRAQIKNNDTYIQASLNDESSNLHAMLDISSSFDRYKTSGETFITLNFNPSTVRTGNQLLSINSEEIIYDKHKIRINDLAIRSNEQGLSINGIISDSPNDTLKVSLSKMNLEPLPGLLRLNGYQTEGHVDGFAEIINVKKSPRITAELYFDDVKVNDHEIAGFDIISRWDSNSEQERFILRPKNSSREIVRGFYRPSNGAFMGNVELSNIPLDLLDPVLLGAVYDSEGSAYISLNVRSANRKPTINGYIEIDSLKTTVDFNKVTYSVRNSRIEIDNGIASMSAVPVHDMEGNSGLLDVKVDINNFSNIAYEAKLLPNNILALNTTYKDNNSFYGKVYASGAVSVKGGKNGVFMNVAATTENNSSFYLPLSNKSSISEANFVRFESKREKQRELDILTLKKQAYLNAMERSGSAGNSNFNISMALNVTPDTDVHLVLNPATNDKLTARGNATLNIEVNPATNDFAIYGNYDITEGEYPFSIQNIVANKLFVISQGSSIVFTGDPMDAILNIKAIYNLKASLAPLKTMLGLSDDNIHGRVPVECIINITEQLSQPKISFGVNVPSTDATLQASLNSLLTTQDMMETQFAWLVAFNAFYADTGSASQNLNTGSAGIPASLGIDFITNQINSLMSTDVTSVTMRYRTGDEYNSDEFDIGFTTEFISDVLIFEVESSYDTGNNPAAVSNSDNPLGISGEIVWVIDKSGNLRLKGFTRTIDRFDEDQGANEYGVGIYYKEDFNKFSDVINKYKARRENRKKAKAEKKALANKPEEETAEHAEEDTINAEQHDSRLATE